MGRRSINTTKSGKYMNPTDQARKEARKRELKKNKKQRMIVRQAVLKGKDPARILEDMELIDKMEYNPLEPPKLNEKVLKDKRKKLKETFDRVLKMYEKEEPEYSQDLRKQYTEYEARRVQLQVYYEQVMNAQKVQLDAIPLPDAPTDQAVSSQLLLPGDIPLPTLPDKPLVRGILKSSRTEHGLHVGLPPLPPSLHAVGRKRKPPGPPPGPPPDLSDSEDEVETRGVGGLKFDLSNISIPGEPPAKSRKIRFEDDLDGDLEEPEKDTRTKYKLQAKILAGQDIPLPPGTEEGDYDEIEGGVEKPEEDDAADEEDVEAGDQNEEHLGEYGGVHYDGDEDGEEMGDRHMPPGRPPPGMPPGPPPGLPPMMYRPPLRGPPGVPPVRLPPGPPPGRPPGRPPGMPPGPPPGLPPNLRMPPRMHHGGGGPHPGMPPRLLRPPGAPPGMPPPGLLPPGTGPPPQGGGGGMNPNILSAPPSISRPPQRMLMGEVAGPLERSLGGMAAAGLEDGVEVEKKSTATIEAKPMIKKLGDVTKFAPTAVKVRRQVKDSRGRILRQGGGGEEKRITSAMPQPAVPAQTKDDAYDAFMKEMDAFL